MTVQLLERVEPSTAWIEAPAERAEVQASSGDEKREIQPFVADDNFVHFVFFGTTAGHPRAMIGEIDDRCLYWQRRPSGLEPTLYRVPAVASGADCPDGVHVRRLRSSADNIKALRELTGLTWEQIARLFGVSRRSVHLWAAGGKLTAGNEELLAELVDLVRSIGAGSPEAIRHELLQVQPGARMSIYDELRSRHSSTPDDINRSAGSAY